MGWLPRQAVVGLLRAAEVSPAGGSGDAWQLAAEGAARSPGEAEVETRAGMASGADLRTGAPWTHITESSSELALA